jgi:hypothetical protein
MRASQSLQRRPIQADGILLGAPDGAALGIAGRTALPGPRLHGTAGRAALRPRSHRGQMAKRKVSRGFASPSAS